MRATLLVLGVTLSWLVCASGAQVEPLAETTYQHPALRPDWQWSVPVSGVVSGETGGAPRAYLWIPPECRRLRGVVVGQHNMEEEQIFEHPLFRKALADIDFAVVWITPPLDLFFRYDQGAGEHFERMLGALAEASGYDELARVPVVPLGHSAAASYPWHFGFWAPDRILAAVSVSGQWPYYRDKNTPDHGTRTLDGVPGLVTMGEYEGAFDRAAVGLKQRAEYPRLPLSMLAEPAGEHFAATDVKIEFIGRYLRAAARHRLPDDWPIDQRPQLRPIDPTATGWLADRGRPDGRATAPAAPVGAYAGDEREAFWYFDAELARAAEAVMTRHAGKRMQLLGYVQNDAVVPQRKSHVRVGLRFAPLDEAQTFRLGGRLLDTVPVDWRGLVAGQPITHAGTEVAPRITRICGPVEQVGPDLFALRFGRVGFDNPKRSNSICFILSHPGDAEHRPTALESEMKVPLVNWEGAPQVIRFEPPAVFPSGADRLELAGTSDAGLPVSYYVREGPAMIEEGRVLKLTAIPRRARMPMKITVVAWQHGRYIAPRIQSAPPVERTITLQP